jgi:enoyl-CoA hydratase/carnithine racemase
MSYLNDAKLNRASSGKGQSRAELTRARLKIGGPVATIHLENSPVNQIDDAMLEQIDSMLDDIEKANVSVLRIRSSLRAFSAGADLKMVRARLDQVNGSESMMHTNRLFQALHERLAAISAVTLAEMSGFAVGGGFELALACDLRIASDDCKIGLPEVKVGLIPGAGGTQRLTLLSGPGVAARLILTGELISGAEAARLGVVQWSYPADRLESEVGRIVAEIALLPAPAIRAAKICLAKALPVQAEGMDAEVRGTGLLMSDHETRARIIAFVNR